LFARLAPVARTLIGVAGTIFAAELAIMLVMWDLGQIPRALSTVMIDAGLVALLTAPPIYLLIRGTLGREYEKRRAAEGRAERATRLAITDSLTEILNRRGITIRLLQSIAQSERYHRPLSVALLDIDRFKEVNDTHGHPAGDWVLKEVARLLTETLRAPDSLGRYGGEEFLLVLPETDLDATHVITERVRRRVRQTDFDVDGTSIKLTVSVGATQFQTGEPLADLFARVDRALYDAKESGRNLVVAR